MLQVHLNALRAAGCLFWVQAVLVLQEEPAAAAPSSAGCRRAAWAGQQRQLQPGASPCPVHPRSATFISLYQDKTYSLLWKGMDETVRVTSIWRYHFIWTHISSLLSELCSVLSGQIQSQSPQTRMCANRQTPEKAWILGDASWKDRMENTCTVQYLISSSITCEEKSPVQKKLHALILQ